MRSLVLSALVISVAALNACSSSDSTPPRSNGSAGQTSTGSAGQTSSSAGQTSTGSAGQTSTGTAGQTSTGSAGATSGSAGATSGSAGATSGSAGATSGTAGSTGTGGASGGCTTTKVGMGTDGLVDGFDTHPKDGNIPATDGRIGGWWISKSATAMVTPMAGAAPVPVMDTDKAGNLALHFAGTDPGTDPNAAWGADASVALAMTGGCYDASVYTGGIKLSMKGTGGVFVSIITQEDKAASATSGNQRKDITLTNAWADYTIPWSDLVTGWGTPIPLDLKEVFALDIAPDATSAASFDIWVDNVQFVK